MRRENNSEQSFVISPEFLFYFIRFALAFLESAYNLNSQALTVTENPQAEEENPFEVLGIPVGISEHGITRAYHRLALIHHPDRGGEHDMFLRISTAYNNLMRNNIAARTPRSLITYPRANPNFEQIIASATGLANRVIANLSNALTIRDTFHALDVPGFSGNPILLWSIIPAIPFMSMPPSVFSSTAATMMKAPTVNNFFQNTTTFLYNENISEIPAEQIIVLDGYAFDLEELKEYAESDITKLFTNPHIKSGKREFSDVAKQTLRDHKMLGIYAKQLDDALLKQKDGIQQSTIDALIKMLFEFHRNGVQGSQAAREQFFIHFSGELNAEQQQHLMNYIIKVPCLMGGDQPLLFEAVLNNPCIKTNQMFLWQFVVDIKPELYATIPKAVLEMAIFHDLQITSSHVSFAERQGELETAMSRFRNRQAEARRNEEEFAAMRQGGNFQADAERPAGFWAVPQSQAGLRIIRDEIAEPSTRSVFQEEQVLREGRNPQAEGRLGRRDGQSFIHSEMDHALLAALLAATAARHEELAARLAAAPHGINTPNAVQANNASNERMPRTGEGRQSFLLASFGVFGQGFTGTMGPNGISRRERDVAEELSGRPQPPALGRLLARQEARNEQMRGQVARGDAPFLDEVDLLFLAQGLHQDRNPQAEAERPDLFARFPIILSDVTEEGVAAHLVADFQGTTTPNANQANNASDSEGDLYESNNSSDAEDVDSDTPRLSY